MPNPSDAHEPEKTGGNTATYGGFLERRRLENREKTPLWKTAFAVSFLLIVILLAVLGAIALFRGDFFPVATENESIIKVPTQKSLEEKDLSSASVVDAAETGLVTVQVRTREKDVLYGTGFLLTDNGYAVCHASLFEAGEPESITAYPTGQTAVSATHLATIEEWGIAVLRLSSEEPFCPLFFGNSSTVKRGQTVYAVGATKKNYYNGLALSAIITSVSGEMALEAGDKETVYPLFYSNCPYDETLDGAPVLDLKGNCVGVLTSTVPVRGGGMAVIPVNALLGAVNDAVSGSPVTP